MIPNYFLQTKKILGTDLFLNLVSHFQGEDFKDFPQYLRENLPDIETRNSFIPELSRLEFLIHTGEINYRDFHPGLDTLDPLQVIKDTTKVDLSLGPNIYLFKSRFPIWDIWEECQKSPQSPDLIHIDLQPKITNPYFYIINQSCNGPLAFPVKKNIYFLIEGLLNGYSFSSMAQKLYAHKEPIVLAKALDKLQSLRLIDNYRVDQR